MQPSPASTVRGRPTSSRWGYKTTHVTQFYNIDKFCCLKTFIQGNKYWRFDNGVLDDDYPRDISVGFDKIPDHVDAAFALPAPHHHGKEKVYFFKGKVMNPVVYLKNVTVFWSFSGLVGISTCTTSMLHFHVVGLSRRPVLHVWVLAPAISWGVCHHVWTLSVRPVQTLHGHVLPQLWAVLQWTLRRQ